MFQLIITIAAIALTSALLVASINYIPWWYKSAADTEEVTRKSLLLVEQAYDVVTRAANGVPPAVGAGADGGFAANFQPVLKLMPAAPAGFSWRYGQATVGEGSWANLHYFCLEFTGDEEGAGEGAWRGMQRVSALYSPQQLVLGNSCGDTAAYIPSSYPAPLAVTLFVAYTPGISR